MARDGEGRRGVVGVVWAWGRRQDRGRGPDRAVSTTNGGGGCLPRAVVLPCVDTSTPTLADVPSTLGEVSVASLDARSSPSCGATEAALAAVDAMGEARGGHTERSLA